VQVKSVHYAELRLNANKMHILEARLGCAGSSPATGTSKHQTILLQQFYTGLTTFGFDCAI
jgi:hypothetical protein